MPFRRIPALVLGALLASSAGAVPKCNELCLQLKKSIASMGATMEACDRAFPQAKRAYVTAFRKWRVLQYKIPGLAELLAGRSPEMALARAAAAEDFTGPIAEQEAQCQQYGAALRRQDLVFPPEWLESFKPAS